MLLSTFRYNQAKYWRLNIGHTLQVKALIPLVAPTPVKIDEVGSHPPPPPPPPSIFHCRDHPSNLTSKRAGVSISERHLWMEILPHWNQILKKTRRRSLDRCFVMTTVSNATVREQMILHESRASTVIWAYVISWKWIYTPVLTRTDCIYTPNWVLSKQYGGKKRSVFCSLTCNLPFGHHVGIVNLTRR